MTSSRNRLIIEETPDEENRKRVVWRHKVYGRHRPKASLERHIYKTKPETVYCTVRTRNWREINSVRSRDTQRQRTRKHGGSLGILE